jgi:hypothetical protein
MTLTTSIPNATLLTIYAAISPARLSTYPGSNPAAKIENYSKNVKITESLLPILQYFEICLRNRIEEVLIKRFGSDWFDNQRFMDMLPEYGKDEMKKAKAKLTRMSRPFSSGAIVAEHTLGFWTSFFSTRLEKSFWVRHDRDLLPHALPEERDAKKLRSDLNSIRDLRNRIAHHERIVNVRTLWRDYRLIIKWIKWMSPEIFYWIRFSKIDRFPSTFRINRFRFKK